MIWGYPYDSGNLHLSRCDGIWGLPNSLSGGFVSELGPLLMGVSINGGTPKSSISMGFSTINHPFWGTPIYGNLQIWNTANPAGHGRWTTFLRQEAAFWSLMMVLAVLIQIPLSVGAPGAGFCRARWICGNDRKDLSCGQIEQDEPCSRFQLFSFRENQYVRTLGQPWCLRHKSFG